MSVPPAQLSCQQCKRRKKKCDKNIPCGACVHASLECTAVQRRRLPRGRSGRKAAGGDEVLRDRVARLEALVTRLRHEQSTPIPSFTVGGRTTVDAFVASDFWIELSETVDGLRDVLESPQSGEEDDEDGHPATIHGNETQSSNALTISSGTSSNTQADMLLFGTMTTLSTHALPQNESWLLDVYHDRVDSIFKVLHWPSVLETLRPHNTSSESSTILVPEAQALVSAMQFTAICALMEHEIPDRQALIKQHRLQTESLLVKGELLISSSFMLLQAFVVYLAGLRACQANAQQWTLTATAVRLANAQGIPFSVSDSISAHDVELRRRLWHSICLLDMQSAFDRGSRPLITSADMEVLPLQIDDIDMSRSSQSVQPKHSFTEMTFSVLVQRAGYCQRKMTEIGNSAFEGAIDQHTATGQQKATLDNFEQESEGLVARCSTPSVSPLQRFTAAVAAESLVAMRLLLYRPLHKRPTRFEPPAVEFDIFGVALNVLERSRDKRSRIEFAKWAWFSWVKWYALAVVLAEICAKHGFVLDYAWDVVQACYEDYANAVADNKSGMLWQPIARLMVKVKGMRKDARLLPHLDDSGTATQNAYPDYVWNDDAMGNELDVSFSKDQVAAQSLDDEGLAWVHWDMLIDDINQFGQF